MMPTQGAEARVSRTETGVTKERIAKSWRHPILDLELRKSRMRREAKVLSTTTIPHPALQNIDETAMSITMEYIEGPTLKEALTQNNAEVLGKQLGAHLQTMHSEGIIHGDLTTSNMILREGIIHFIDFGLSQFSDHVEDKATDMHMLRQVLDATHPELHLWNHVLDGYKPDKDFLERYAQVESRGRYKKK